MTNTQMTISSVEDYIVNIKKDIEKWPKEVRLPWFRGDREIPESLQPRIFRNDNINLVENDINQEFRMRAPALFYKTPKYERIDEWLFLMQHSYPFPTRLLDWTESALAALFFATNNLNDERDPMVWMINPRLLNISFSGRRYLPLSWNDGSNFYDKQFGTLELNKRKVFETDKTEPDYKKKYTRKKCISNFSAAFGDPAYEEDYPVALSPQHIHTRVTAQRGCFTIHGKIHDPINAIFDTINGSKIDDLKTIVNGNDDNPKEAVMKKYKICSDKKLKKKMLFDLKILGISQATLFPDLDGLGKELSTNYLW